MAVCLRGQNRGRSGLLDAILMQAPRSFAFDLDGTLADTAGEIAAALAQTFVELGLRPLAAPDVERLIGRGVGVLVERALALVGAKGVAQDAAVSRFEAKYAALIGTTATLYPGAEAQKISARAP
ncbi:MAG: HAD hydrolase-like protein, partial [Caldimonas sp.]